MMKKALLLLLGLVLLNACSSGSGSDEVNELDASNVGNVNATFNAIEGLLFDESVSETRLTGRNLTGTTGDQFSFMGCHYIQDRQRMIDDIKSIRVPLCYMSGIEEYLDSFEIPEGEYAYYKIIGQTEGDSGGPPTDEGAFLLRVGKFTVDGRNSLRYQGCNGGEQSEDFYIIEREDGVRARSSHRFTHEIVETGEVISGRGSLDLIAKGATADEIDELEINSAFRDYWGMGSSTLYANRADRKNAFIGRFSNDWVTPEGTFGNEFGVCVFSGDGVGSGRTEGSWQSPAYYVDQDLTWYCPPSFDSVDGQSTIVAEGYLCTQEFVHQESFRLGGADPLVIESVESPWTEDAASCEIPVSPESVTPYDKKWNCQAPDGFVELDMSEIPLAAIQECIDIEESRNQDFVSCEEKFNQEVQDKTAGDGSVPK